MKKLGIVEFHEVGRTLVEVLHEETLGIANFHEVRISLKYCMKYQL